MNQDHEFSVALALRYMRTGLLEHALKLLDQVPEDDLNLELSRLKISLLVRIYTLMNDFPRAIFYTETMNDKNSLPQSVLKDLTAAYWNTGEKGKALNFLEAAGSYIPNPSIVQKYSESITPVDNKISPDNLEELLSEAARLKLGYHFVLDNLAPLIWQIRPATCCFLDQIPLLLEAEDFAGDEAHQVYLSFVELMRKEFQIHVAFLPYLTEVLPGMKGIPLLKIYCSRSNSVFQKVRELSLIFQEEVSPWPGPSWRTFLEKEADLLGYPECCSRKAIDLRTRGPGFEVEAKADLIRETLRCQFQSELPFPCLAYFTFEFSPCDPRCQAAERIGHQLAESYRKFIPLPTLYEKLIVPLNQGMVVHYGMSYQDFIGSFDEHLEASTGEFGKRLAFIREERSKQDDNSNSV